MKSFSVSTTINASPQTVWALLTDVVRWPEWNPTVDRVTGSVARGATVTVYTKASPGRAFPVRVTELLPRERMVWSGGMPFGLFKGERVYTLRPAGTGVEFSMREGFSGPLAGLITRSIPDLQPAFDAFGAALKERAEGR